MRVCMFMHKQVTRTPPLAIRDASSTQASVLQMYPFYFKTMQHIVAFNIIHDVCKLSFKGSSWAQCALETWFALCLPMAGPPVGGQCPNTMPCAGYCITWEVPSMPTSIFSIQLKGFRGQPCYLRWMVVQESNGTNFVLLPTQDIISHFRFLQFSQADTIKNKVYQKC